MLTVESAAFFSSVFTIFIANVLIVTIVSYIRSVVAAYFGDETALHMGLATLNPIAHIDAIFLISFMIVGIGLSQYPAININYIRGDYKLPKFYVASFINTFLYIVLGIFSLTALLIFFGPSILELFRTIAFADGSVMRFFPHLSSVAFSLALIGTASVYVNSTLAIISLVVNLVRLVGFPLFNALFSQSKHRDLWVLASIVLVIYLLFDVLHWLTRWIILGAGYTLAYFFGVGV